MKYYFWLGLLSIYFLIAAVLYSPSLSGPWQYDDYAQILDEKVLTGRSLPLLLSSTFMFKAHPDGWTGTRDLVRASFLLNWQWWGNEPAGYRWVNLLIHVVNATMVAGLIYLLMTNDELRMTNDKKPKAFSFNIQHSTFNIPILAGLLFLVHPLNSQAVAYVAQRFTSMATMFYLLAIVLYIFFCEVYETSHHGRTFRKLLIYSAALLSAAFAFNSKEIAVTLPVILLLVTIVSEKARPCSARPGLNKIFRFWSLALFFLLALKIPFQIVSSSFGNTISMDKVAEVAADSFALKQKAVDLTRHDYFLTQINVVGTYLRLAVIPIRQTLDYDYPVTKNFDPKTIALAVFHLSLIGFSILLIFNPFNHSNHSNHSFLRFIGLGLLWFYLTLLPESSVVPIADLIYEHRTYLPMVGLIIAMAGAIAQIQNSIFKIQKFPFYFLLITLYSLLSIATLRRAWVWGNEVRLWADIYEKAPNKPRANKNYGVVLAAAGKYEEGVKRLARAVELEPENADYWSNFGTAYLRWGKYEEASGKFLKAYELFSSQKGLGNLSDLGNLSNLTPKDLKQAAQYMNDYGVAMVQSGHADEALAGFEKALKIDPTLYAAWLGLGAAYNLKDDSEMSIKIFTKTVNDFPNMPDGYNNLAIVLKKAGRIEEAAAVLVRMPKKSP